MSIQLDGKTRVGLTSKSLSKDADMLAILHQRIFPKNLMSVLGQRFLKHYYYQALRSSHARVFVKTDLNGCAWSVVYISSADFLSEYRRLPINVIFSALMNILFRPDMWLGLLYSSSRVIMNDGDSCNRPVGYEVAIVASSDPGSGLASEVFTNAVMWMKNDPTWGQVHLEVDLDNKRAQQFYKKHGFFEGERFLKFKRRMLFMEFLIDE